MCPKRRPTSRSATRLHHRGAATAALATRLRRELHDWAAFAGIPADTVDDLTLSSYEAMANTVRHAYPAGTTGFLELHANLEREDVVVTVADNGRWAPTPDERDPVSDGSYDCHGLRLIHDLAAHSEVVRDERGTTVLMTWPRRSTDVTLPP
ncbi:MAG TPA: ATP-binding protein [Actinophytocola sp.]|jgi:serine/threonine-protein kinase RsbW|nr:ATP-binding protein [Actinophytocola sp.]